MYMTEMLFSNPKAKVHRIRQYLPVIVLGFCRITHIFNGVLPIEMLIQCLRLNAKPYCIGEDSENADVVYMHVHSQVRVPGCSIFSF